MTPDLQILLLVRKLLAFSEFQGFTKMVGIIYVLQHLENIFTITLIVAYSR